MSGIADGNVAEGLGRAVGVIAALDSLRSPGGLSRYLANRQQLLADPDVRASLIGAPFSAGVLGIGTEPLPQAPEVVGPPTEAAARGVQPTDPNQVATFDLFRQQGVSPGTLVPNLPPLSPQRQLQQLVASGGVDIFRSLSPDQREAVIRENANLPLTTDEQLEVFRSIIPRLVSFGIEVPEARLDFRPTIDRFGNVTVGAQQRASTDLTPGERVVMDEQGGVVVRSPSGINRLLRAPKAPSGGIPNFDRLVRLESGFLYDPVTNRAYRGGAERDGLSTRDQEFVTRGEALAAAGATNRAGGNAQVVRALNKGQVTWRVLDVTKPPQPLSPDGERKARESRDKELAGLVRTVISDSEKMGDVAQAWNPAVQARFEALTGIDPQRVTDEDGGFSLQMYRLEMSLRPTEPAAPTSAVPDAGGPLSRAPSLPFLLRRFAKAPVPPTDPRFRAATVANRLVPGMMEAVAHIETKFGLHKRRSSARAEGLMQFVPETAARFGINPLDDNQAIEGAGRYLKFLLDRYGDPATALLAYHSGEGNVDKGRIGPAGRNYYRQAQSLIPRYAELYGVGG